MPGDVGLDRLERPANLGRGVGLHVPGVDLARGAEVEDHDARCGRDPCLNAPWPAWAADQLRQREPDRPQRADLQEIAAVTPSHVWPWLDP